MLWIRAAVSLLFNHVDITTIVYFHLPNVKFMQHDKCFCKIIYDEIILDDLSGAHATINRHIYLHQKHSLSLLCVCVFGSVYWKKHISLM